MVGAKVVETVSRSMGIFSFRNIPNSLTAFRVVIIPVFVWSVYSYGWKANTVSASLFMVAALTDWFDGWLARKMELESDFGKLFDPLADKLLVLAALVVLW